MSDAEKNRKNKNCVCKIWKHGECQWTISRVDYGSQIPVDGGVNKKTKK